MPSLVACSLILLLSAGCAAEKGPYGQEESTGHWTTLAGYDTASAGGSVPAGLARISTPEEFDDQVLKSELPVLVEFYMPGCGGCILLAPVLESIQPEYAGRVKFVAIDGTRAYSLVRSNGVRVTPTCLVFVDGHETGRMIGDRSQAVMRRFIDGAVEKGRAS